MLTSTLDTLYVVNGKLANGMKGVTVLVVLVTEQKRKRKGTLKSDVVQVELL